jgi:hypothetical protein
MPAPLPALSSSSAIRDEGRDFRAAEASSGAVKGSPTRGNDRSFYVEFEAQPTGPPTSTPKQFETDYAIPAHGALVTADLRLILLVWPNPQFACSTSPCRNPVRDAGSGTFQTAQQRSRRGLKLRGRPLKFRAILPCSRCCPSTDDKNGLVGQIAGSVFDARPEVGRASNSAGIRAWSAIHSAIAHDAESLQMGL